MPVQHKLHVVTYVWRKGDADPDVLAHQILENAADPKAGVEGDATKVVLSQAQNYQCHGEDGTDGCEKCHGHAEERVIARLVGEDKVAVAWRKYHPLAARGTVKPGQPFEAEHDGLKVRVEARVISDDAGDVITNKAVSMIALRALEADLAKKHAAHEQREQLRTVVTAFNDGPLQQTRLQLAQITDRAKDVPGAKKALAAVDKALDAIGAAVDKELGALLNKPDVGPADLQAITALVQQETAKLAPALQPAIQLEANARDLVAVQGEIRAVLADAEAVDARVAEGKALLPGIDDKALPGGDVHELCEALLDETREKEGFAAADARKQLQPLAQLVQQRSAALDAAAAVERPKKDAFDERVQRLVDLKSGALKAQLVDYAEACGAAAGFNVKHWAQKIAAAVDATAKGAPNVGKLSYDKPADNKALDAAEQKVAPLTAALAELDADVNKRIDPYPVHAVRNIQLTPPSVWIKVKNVRADGNVDVVVNARNNGAHALLVDIKNEDGSAVHRTVSLSKKGERATFTLDNVPKRFSVTITAVGPEVDRAANANVNLARCVVSAGSVLGIEGKGTVRHMPPLYFTPSPQQPNDAVAHAFGAELPEQAGVVYSQQRIPGGE